MVKNFDPIELELFKNRFTSISEEMAAVLGRTALSPNIKERKDFSCALFTNKGETFAQGSHIPVHLGAMPLSVQACLNDINFKEGDLIILNDPYRGGTHLPDITCVSPVFIKNKLFFFVANRAHHSDVGGMTPGSMPLATEIFQEGVIIPPLKLIRKGKIEKSVLALLLANVRTPEERQADLQAQIAANERGIKRLKELASTFGLEKTIFYASLIQDYTESFLRRTLEKIPDGTYTFTDYMDDDGISSEPVPIGVILTIRGDEAVIDFSPTSSQVEGSINANLAVTLSACLYVFRCLVEEDIPFNTGLMRPLKIKVLPGSLLNPVFPAPVSGGNVETSQRIVDVLLGALAKALPEKIPAASSGTMNNIAVGAFEYGKKNNFAYYETIGGGMGAGKGKPGLSGVHTHMTNSMNTPIEALENYFPLKIRSYKLRRGSGGKGLWPGGEGIIREYEFLIPAQVTIISERRKFSPFGAAGGKAGKPGRNTLKHNGKSKRLGSKVNVKVQPGDILCLETPGGGGYGCRKK